MKNFKILTVIDGERKQITVPVIHEKQARQIFSKKHPGATISEIKKE